MGQFKEKHWKELKNKEATLLKLAKESRKRNITFIFGSREERLNNAAALKEYIWEKFRRLTDG